MSTEQIIHPDKYLIDEGPNNPTLPDITEAMGRG
jgi:hypothetical protein